jgi:hypothetical protein
MGYYTEYSLNVLNAETKETHPHEIEVIKELIEQCKEAEYALSINGSTKEASKWYSRDIDLREFSKKYPSLLFELYGEGEDGGDLWREYYLNGKMQRDKAQLTYKDFTLINLFKSDLCNSTL